MLVNLNNVRYVAPYGTVKDSLNANKNSAIVRYSIYFLGILYIVHRCVDTFAADYNVGFAKLRVTDMVKALDCSQCLENFINRHCIRRSCSAHYIHS